MDIVEIVGWCAAVFAALCLFWYLCSTIRGVGEDVRDAICMQTQAIERHTSFVQRECERERIVRLPAPPRVPSVAVLGGQLDAALDAELEQRYAGMANDSPAARMARDQQRAALAGATEQGFRNTQRRL